MKLRLRAKLLCILIVSSTILLSLLYILTSSVLLKGFVTIEDKQIAKNTERLHKFIIDDENILKTTISAWSTWENSYHFIQDRNPKYISSTYLIDSIFDNNFSGIVIFDLEGNIIFSQDYDLKNRKFNPSDPNRLKDIQKYLFKSNPHPNTNIPYSGYYGFNNTFDFFSLNPILPGNGLGKPNGYLLFFRRFDSEMFKRYEKIMQLKLYPTIIKGIYTKKTNISYQKKENEIIAELSLPGVLNRNTLSIKIPMHRDIYLYGKKTTKNYIAITALLSFLVVVMIYHIFDRYIIRRILNLKKDLTEIAREQPEMLRVTVEGTDEIGNLANNINFTLNALDQKQMVINRTSKFAALGEMAASIAHEINNPLTIIAGYSSKIAGQMESKEFDKEAISNNARKIISTVSRIEKIIKSLRVISRDGEQDKMTVTTIGEIFEDVYSLCLAKIKYKSIEMKLSEFVSNISIEARPVQIAQVLINLINNSIDAIEDTPHPWIKVKAEETENEIIVSVSDSGNEIPDDIAQKIMSPFFTTKAPGKGTGLGLNISKKIVESHGGQLILETRPHTCFKMILPKKRVF